MIIVPLGLALVLWLTPKEVIESARQKAEHSSTQPVSYLMGAAFVIIWIVVLYLFAVWIGDVAF